MFCASPGRARKAIVAEQIEKSANLPSSAMLGDRIDVIVNGKVAQRFRPDVEVFIVKELEDRFVGRRVRSFPQNRNSLGANRWHRVIEQALDSAQNLLMLSHFVKT